MPYANNSGVRIHYQVEGEGPALVLQHGFGDSFESWYELGYVDAQRPRYRLILLEARGHRASDKPHDPDAYVLTAADPARSRATGEGCDADRRPQGVPRDRGRRAIPQIRWRHRDAPAGGRIDMSGPDGSRTAGVTPSKTNWAPRIDTPPFYAFPVRPGITFTYLGVTVDAQARVITTSGAPMPHAYAAGECKSGNILRSV